MPTRTKTLIALVAAALLGGASWLSPPVGAPLAFITCFTVFMMWALGITRTPRFVHRKRRAAAEQPRRLAEPHPDVPERWFPEQPKRWARAFLYVNGAVPVLGGLVCLATLLAPPPEAADVQAVLTVFGCLLLAYGAFFLRFAQRLPRMGVRTDPRGVEAVGALAERRIAWDDVVAFTAKTYRMSGVDYQTNYRLYGPETSLEISGKLAGVEELLQIVRDNIPPEAGD
jgi:hypothetical protein